MSELNDQRLYLIAKLADSQNKAVDLIEENAELKTKVAELESVITDAQEIESMLELAWTVICEYDYENYDYNLKSFMENKS